MATCGLRACEVVTLTLDDMEWRARRLRIPQRKTRRSLGLPLTDEVGEYRVVPDRSLQAELQRLGGEWLLPQWPAPLKGCGYEFTRPTTR